MQTMYDYLYPIERRVMEDRLNWLEKEYYRFDYMINPYHVQPGLLLDVDITSIKRKKATLDAMANVLNEFLHGVSKGFQDAAFASFSRRRSTVREDINQTFGGGEESSPAAAPASAYLDLINSEDSAASTEAPASAGALVAKSARQTGRSKAAAGGGKKRGRKASKGGIREV
jgi:hypothetical protein